MLILNDVSKTALLTLRGRVIEANRENPLIHDKMGARMLAGIQKLLPAEMAGRIMSRRLPKSYTNYIALRARRYDDDVHRFLKDFPDGLVVSLGCGFDTRYWRVSREPWNYIEIDLPEVIEAKKQALGGMLDYAVFGCSVLRDEWMEEIRSMRGENVLFLAEGLFMYLPEKGVRHIFFRLAQMFSNSQIVFEAVQKKYTRGLRKKLLESKMKRIFGSDAGSAYSYGVRRAEEVESYASGIKVLEEWSYFEEEDLRPKILKMFRRSKAMTRTQWTIRAALG